MVYVCVLLVLHSVSVSTHPNQNHLSPPSTSALHLNAFTQNILYSPINIQQGRTPNICGREYILWVGITEFESCSKNSLVSQLRKPNLTSLKSRGSGVTVPELEPRSPQSHFCPISIDFVSLWSCPGPASHGLLCFHDGWERFPS